MSSIVRQKTLALYLVTEILPPFLIGLLLFTLVLLIARILKLIELVVTRGVPLVQIGKLFGLILPTFLEMSVPMALLLAVFIGLGRLSHDHEILALKASGVSPYQILLPVTAVALFISLVTLLTTTVLRPAANLALKKELYNIAKNRIGTALKEKVFNDDFPNILIYIEEIVPPGNTAQGLLIVDRRDPKREDVIFGKVALILPDEESKGLTVKLFDGTIYEREKNRPGFSRTHFNIYDFKLDLTELLAPIRKKERGPKEMSLRRLYKTIQLKEEKGLNPISETIELHQRFSFAIAPLVFSLLGVSLVLLPKSSRAGRSWGLTLCLFWILVYYGLLSLGKALAEGEFLPPLFALWIPNVVIGLIAAQLFRKALRESPLFSKTSLATLASLFNRKLAHDKPRTY